jgi:hypothetical protein
VLGTFFCLLGLWRLSVGFFFFWLTSLLTLLVHGQAMRLVRLVFVTWALYPTDCTIFPPQSTAILCGEKLSSRRGKPCFPFDMKQDYVYAMSYALYPHDSLPSFFEAP